MSAKYTFLAWDTPIANAPLKLALLQLANNADDNGFSFYSISKMAISCGMSERTFMRKIVDLEKMGVLEVQRRSNRPSLYTLIGDEMGVTLCHLQSPQVTECHGGVTESHLVGDRESHDLNSTPNISLNNNMSVINEAFDHFWNIYPSTRRKNKKGCFSKFKSKCKGMSESEIESFINDISLDIKQRISNLEDLKYMPMTEPYLNQERWEDGK